MLRITKRKNVTVSKPAKQLPTRIPIARIVNMIRRPVLEKIVPSRKMPLEIHRGKEGTTKLSVMRRAMYGNKKDDDKQNMAQVQLDRAVEQKSVEKVISKQKQTQIPFRPIEIETTQKKQALQKQEICESIEKKLFIFTQQQLSLQNQSKDNQLQQKDSKLEQKDSKLEQKDSKLKYKDSKLEQKDNQLQQKDSKLEQKDNQLESKDRKSSIARQSILERQPASAESPARFLSLPSKKEDIEADMQRIMARRQEREERKRQQKQREEMKIVEGEAGEEPHMMHLPNELEHFQMSIKQIDQQVSTLLRMKPNILAKIQSKPIRAKFQQLQRFNESYRLIMEDDPANRLTAGLRNYMIALMNQIGEIIQQDGQGVPTIQVDNSIRLPFARTRGLSLEEMQSVMKLTEFEGANQDHHCAICLLNLESKTLLYEVSCGHTFHKACLEEWVITTASCPSCRRNFKK